MDSIQKLEQIRTKKIYGLVIGTTSSGYQADVVNFKLALKEMNVKHLDKYSHSHLWKHYEADTFDKLISKIFRATRQ